MAKDTRNVGRIDRVIRMLLAILFAFVILSNILGNWGNLVLFALTAFVGYTSLASSCPIYRMFGKSTFSK
jgi:hypothetical protein